MDNSQVFKHVTRNQTGSVERAGEERVQNGTFCVKHSGGTVRCLILRRQTVTGDRELEFIICS